MKAFNIEGVDPEAGTVVLEVDKAILVPMFRALFDVRPNNTSQTHIACHSLAAHLRNACKVLYGEAKPEEFGFDILEPANPHDEVIAKTA